ncbi:MAG TPA: hypothetical protein DCP90_09170 [Clostridiales bacterium]|nr:MAG: hypothetical protein A2Y22_02930 [Clostridiales bacterium GWD2_32_59]HAN10763.1 hypothetical protein [Clostridiales bacterium]
MSKQCKVKSLQEVQRETIRRENQKKAEFKVILYIVVGILVTVAGIIFFLESGRKECLLKVKDVEIGYVRNNDVAMEMIEKAKVQLETELGTKIKITEQPSFEIVSSGKGIDKDEIIIKALKENLEYELSAYTITIDSKPFGVLVNAKDINQVLNDLKNKFDDKKETVDFVSDSDNLKLWFKEEVVILNESVKKDKIDKIETITAKLSGSGTKVEVYEVKEGDTISEIASHYDDIGLKDIVDMNPGINLDKLKIGQKLNLSTSKTPLSVITKEEKTYEEIIPKAKEISKLDSKPLTYKKVVKEGKEGKKTVTANIIKINGVEEKKEVISQQVLVEPITEVVIVGTQKISERSSPGIYAMPAVGAITSKFGEQREGHIHQGIDIANDVGTSIYAAGNGTVSETGYDAGGYGNYIKIKHSNGFETLYGHLSKIKVSQGDKVTKQDKIGLMGNTGRSTGSHVHVEVIKNGKKLNPLNYVR